MSMLCGTATRVARSCRHRQRKIAIEIKHSSSELPTGLGFLPNLATSSGVIPSSTHPHNRAATHRVQQRAALLSFSQGSLSASGNHAAILCR